VGKVFQGCTVGNQKKDVEVKLDGAEDVKASGSADIYKKTRFGVIPDKYVKWREI
jgi:hypothetical protein